MSTTTQAEEEIHLSRELNRQVKTWCGLHGLLYTDGNINFTPAPISLFPDAFSKSAFEYVVKIQPIWNKLVDRISRDKEFLLRELKGAGNADEFTHKIIEIYEQIPTEALKTQVQFGVFRSDYMVNEADDRALQVEINTIAASFGCLSQRVHEFHDFILARNHEDREFSGLAKKIYENDSVLLSEVKSKLQENKSLQNIATGLAAAHKASTVKDNNAVVLFIVQPNERNFVDQSWLEEELFTNHNIKVHFTTLEDINDHAVIQDDALYIQHPIGGTIEVELVPVSLIYFRAGYTPNDYTTEKHWNARRKIEIAHRTIKCPNVGYHLTGAKAIQAALTKNGVLEKFLTVEESQLLRETFAKQYALGDDEIKETVKEVVTQAIEDGKHFVLKPQREGGGNNYYGEQLSEFLKQHQNDPLLSGFVLMQRIFPRTQLTAFHRNGKTLIAPSISELGVYGVYLSPGSTDIQEINEYSGYLLRTKGSGVDEGGVATGYSVLNSVYLV